MRVKKLLITADDYGVHKTIDDGIIESIPNIDCIDIIVTHDGAKESISRLLSNTAAKERLQNGSLKLGLHLTLNVGKPQYRDLNSEECKKYLRAISLCKGYDTQQGSEFKHKGVPGLLVKMDMLIKKHRNALKQEIIHQYLKFKAYTGIEPFHVSSHSGVFNGHPKFYALLRETCKKDLNLLPIRCPSIIAYDQLPGLKSWREAKQQLLKKRDLKVMSLLPREGPVVKRWMKKGQRIAFDEDMKREDVKSTDFFVPHFYLQGSMSNFKSILRRMIHSPRQGEQSYEVVVHPVQFGSASEYHDMPRGIKTKTFPLRRMETRTLTDPRLRKIIEDSATQQVKIETFKSFN